MLVIKLLTKNSGGFVGEKIEINKDEIVLKNPKIIGSGTDGIDLKKSERNKEADIVLHINKTEVICYYEVEEQEKS